MSVGSDCQKLRGALCGSPFSEDVLCLVQHHFHRSLVPVLVLACAGQHDTCGHFEAPKFAASVKKPPFTGGMRHTQFKTAVLGTQMLSAVQF